MSREIRFSPEFDRGWRQLLRLRKVHRDDLDTIVYLLAKGEPLPPEFADHPLTDDREGFREFHLSGNIIVIYKATASRVTVLSVSGHEVFRHRKHQRKGTRHLRQDARFDDLLAHLARAAKRWWKGGD